MNGSNKLMLSFSGWYSQLSATFPWTLF